MYSKLNLTHKYKYRCVHITFRLAITKKINNLFATATNRRLRIPFHINNVQEQVHKKVTTATIPLLGLTPCRFFMDDQFSVPRCNVCGAVFLAGEKGF